VKSQLMSFGSRAGVLALVCLIVLIGRAAPATSDGDMAGMSGHMYMTTIRPMQGGDRPRADALVESARAAMAPYQDYHKALSDGYQIFLPNVPQPQYHFTKYEAPAGQKAAYFGPEAKFGLRGSIISKEACEAASGEFYPHLFGWMVHVYPYESDPKNIWSTDDDAQGHDNMDHSAMPGMKMP